MPKKIKKPLISDVQRLLARQKARRLFHKYQNYDFIIDDESYFTLTHSTILGNNIFYSNDTSLTNDDVKYNFKSKYEKKLLVWMCISTRGMWKPFFVPSGMAVNQDAYLDMIIKRHLEPFIEKHHRQGKYVFAGLS